MTRNPKAITLTVIVSAMIVAQSPPKTLNESKANTMHAQIHLVWNAVEDNLSSEREVYFLFSPGHGLTDIDFHSITAREWGAMKSPSAEAIARLQVGKETTLTQVEEVVSEIAEKGGYKKVVVTVRL